MVIVTIPDPRSCWSDLYDTLMEAQNIICITGWAVWHKLELFRGPDQSLSDGHRKYLGDILVEKANQGVKVRGGYLSAGS